MKSSLSIEFLGTGTSSGVPMVACRCSVCASTDRHDKRLRSSVLIRSEQTTVIIDTTPDFRYQMLRSRVEKLDAVVFTHSHKDHLAGLDDVKGFNFSHNASMPLYANAETAAALQRDFYYAFADTKYPGVPELDLHPIDDQPFMVGDLHFIPIRVKHLHMHVTGFRIGDFTYITDANHIDDQELRKIMGSKILVLNALRKQKHLSHFTLEEAIAVAQQVGAEQTYFTHISHQLGFHAEVSRELPEGIHLAYDGLTVYLD
ncbi:MAG: MBL fold metallo-hydrolase [Bacteroidota bacterium]